MHERLEPGRRQDLEVAPPDRIPARRLDGAPHAREVDVPRPERRPSIRSRVLDACASVAGPIARRARGVGAPLAVTVLAVDALTLLPAVGLRVDFGGDGFATWIARVVGAPWHSHGVADFPSLAFGLGLAHVACGLWCCATLGRATWRNLAGGAAARPSFGVDVPVPDLETGSYVRRRLLAPVVRWRRPDGSFAVTWPGAVLGVGACVLASMYAPGLGLPAPEWSMAYYATGRSSESATVPVWSVQPGSRLEQAGLLVGDVVESADGRPVRSSTDLSFATTGAYGHAVDVVVRRPSPGPDHAGPTLVTLHVQVDARPRNADGSKASVVRGDVGDVRGLFDWSPERRSMSFSRRTEVWWDEATTYASILTGLTPVDDVVLTEDADEMRHFAEFAKVMFFVGGLEQGSFYAACLLLSTMLLSTGVPGRRRRPGVRPTEDASCPDGPHLPRKDGSLLERLGPPQDGTWWRHAAGRAEVLVGVT